MLCVRATLATEMCRVKIATKPICLLTIFVTYDEMVPVKQQCKQIT